MNTIRLNTIGDSPIIIKKGSQVQSQEKTVEITENGTTEVVPDSGFSLSKVTVNTNVESGGGESTMVYYLKPTTLDNAFAEMAGFAAQIVKVDVGQKVVAAPLFLLEFGNSLFDYIIAFGVNPDTKLVLPNHTGTVSEIFGNTLATYTEITEDEFYNLEA